MIESKDFELVNKKKIQRDFKLAILFSPNFGIKILESLNPKEEEITIDI